MMITLLALAAVSCVSAKHPNLGKSRFVKGVHTAPKAAADPIYWWFYPNMDAESEDIRQLPCAATCTIAELEAACEADVTCVAFNTHGWLKKSIADQAPDSCNLYVKKTTPQPSPTPTPSPIPLPLWPLPISLKTGTTTLSVSPSLTFTTTGGNADLDAYAARTKALMFQHSAPAPTGPALSNVNILVSNPTAPLVLGVDESYNLTIPSDGSAATLSAVTNYGAYFGLQTLAQAVRFDFDARGYAVPFTPIAVVDYPKFAWRGFLIDTDRHWLSIPTLYSIIDSLTYTKGNIMHWHLVDWQSWPLESVAVPGLWNRSWSARERYTLDDVSMVIEYARARGVRVVVEYDTPGHASSMCFAYPELCPSASCSYQGNSPLTPVPDAQGKPVALNAIQGVLTELAARNTDEFFHLGGDEVDQSCWANTPAVTDWMKTQGYNTTDQVYEYFVEKVDAMTIALNKSPIRWEEVWKHFGTDLDKRTVIHAWLSSDALIDATSKGYRAIWSVDGRYYLDALSEPWQSFYSVDILAEMWGETADGSDVMQTIWPRAAAAVERQWSYDVTSNTPDASVAYRLQAFRCFLLERGIAAAPVTNADARQAPAGPGSCMMQ